KYDYSLVEYKGIFSPIKIICPIHGIFEQTPDSHINANCGCPSCNESKGEKKIKKLLNQYNIKYIEQYWFPNCIYKRPLRFDFYLPDYNILVEYQGIQHFVRVKYWDKKQSLEIRQQRDKIKKDFCINERIPLLIINYDEDIERKLRTYLYLPEES
ncbi:MAG: DUF723 domain-containing protein, partial [Elusimicrobiota bacterium]|nr:DUF723 domain-containing protein [Elusimicrobiota bacterium]